MLLLLQPLSAIVAMMLKDLSKRFFGIADKMIDIFSKIV